MQSHGDGLTPPICNTLKGVLGDGKTPGPRVGGLSPAFDLFESNQQNLGIKSIIIDTRTHTLKK